MLKLILADNQAIFRAGIAKVLAVEDEMRIVAQAQTSEQMFMALDKFRAAVLIVAGGFHNEFNGVLQAANKVRTRVVVLGDTGESAQKYMGAGAHGVVYRNVTSSALVDCVRKVARGETWIQDIAVPSELTENDMVGLRVRDRLTAKELRIVALIVQGYQKLSAERVRQDWRLRPARAGAIYDSSSHSERSSRRDGRSAPATTARAGRSSRLAHTILESRPPTGWPLFLLTKRPTPD